MTSKSCFEETKLTYNGKNLILIIDESAPWTGGIIPKLSQNQLLL